MSKKMNDGNKSFSSNFWVVLYIIKPSVKRRIPKITSVSFQSNKTKEMINNG